MMNQVIGVDRDLKRELLVLMLWLTKRDRKEVVYGYLVSIPTSTKMSAFRFMIH